MSEITQKQGVIAIVVIVAIVGAISLITMASPQAPQLNADSNIAGQAMHIGDVDVEPTEEEPQGDPVFDACLADCADKGGSPYDCVRYCQEQFI